MLSILFLLASTAIAAPIDSCVEQSECLHVTIDDLCDVNNDRMVCIYWDDTNPNCVKDSAGGSGSVSHSCSGVGGDKDLDGDGFEDWYSGQGNALCQVVHGGDTAVFGVKDGSGCSAAGVYDVNGVIGACTGPLNVCSGKNTKECLWSIDTLSCGGSGTIDPCEDDNGVCTVQIPCITDSGCPCKTFQFGPSSN